MRGGTEERRRGGGGHSVRSVPGTSPVGSAQSLGLGIARALLKVNPDFRAQMKPKGLLTRDPREVERKKYGLKKARKAPQFSKR